MKVINNTIQILSSSLVLKVFANSNSTDALGEVLSEIQEELDLDGRKFNHIINMAYTKLEDHPNFLPTYEFPDKRDKRKAFQRMMMNYGCHCFPNHKSTIGGKGQPVDQLDEACRSLYKCHKCVDIEYPNECETDNGGYKYDMDPVTKDLSCEASEKHGDCKVKLCECETHFVETIYDLWVGENSSWSYNTKFWLDKKWTNKNEREGLDSFDRDNVCVISLVNVEADSCCGDFPSIIPYSSSEKNCCANGEVKPNFMPCDDLL